MTLALYFLGLLPLVAAFLTGEPCRIGWYHHQEKCYMFSTQPEKMTDAEMFCRVLGGHLAEISDQDVNDFLKRTAKTRDRGHNFYVGLTDEAQSNKWAWIQSRLAPNFTDWASGQPEDNDEHCVFLLSQDDFQWHDVNCDIPQFFICEEQEVDSGSSIIG